MATAQFRPEITPEMRAAALENPNSWLYVIDPALDPDGEVPPWGVVGAYPVNERGEIEDAFVPNAGYRPAPAVPGTPPTPATPAIPAIPAAVDLERLLELVRDGQRDQTELLPAVLAARLLVYASGPADTAVTGFPDRRLGTIMVPACTSPARVPPSWPGWREITGRELVPLLSGHPLVINPGGPVAALLPAADLAAALGSDPTVGR